MNSTDPGFLKLSREAFKAASDSICDLAGTDAAYSFVCMGADGTPTSRIDLAAEDAIIEVLKNEGRSIRIISEERGELILGDSPEYSIVLDPLDGTYNSSVGIPILQCFNSSFFLRSFRHKVRVCE